MSYEDKTIDYNGIYLYESKLNYENIYSYDESVQYSPIGFDGSTDIYMANIFVSREDEILEAVSFYTTDVNTEYKVYIYKNLTDRDDPASGEIASFSHGIKKLPGYHTIKLEEYVQLKENDTFSVVVYVCNPTQELTAQVEAIYMKYRIQSEDDVSNKGESYVSHNGEEWVDIHQKIVSDPQDITDYMRLGNFAIKAFTSSDKYVKFSIEGGDVSFKEKLELTSIGADEIYYTVDGTDPVENGCLYTSPIELSEGLTVSAVGKKDGQYGKVITQAYKQAKASVNALSVTDAKITYNYDTNDSYIGTYLVANGTENVYITIDSHDEIYINSQEVVSDQPTAFPLEQFRKNTFTIEVKKDGYIPRTYTLELYVNPISYNYENETIHFNEDEVDVLTNLREEVSNGQSVTKWLDKSGKTSFLIDFGEEYCLTPLPKRIEISDLEIDYIAETSSNFYSEKVYYKTDASADFDELNFTENGYIPVFPGKTMYLFAPAQNDMFASKVVKWEIPERPTVENIKVESITKTKISFTYFDNLEYYCYDEDVKYSDGVYRSLIPGKEYYFEICLPATENTFSATVFADTVSTESDNTLDKLQKTIDKAETEPDFVNRLAAFFARIIYSIRLLFVTIFE